MSLRQSCLDKLNMGDIGVNEDSVMYSALHYAEEAKRVSDALTELEAELKDLVDDLNKLRAKAVTIPYGEPATADLDDTTNIITFGIPVGEPGADGPQGPQGEPGPVGMTGEKGPAGEAPIGYNYANFRLENGHLYMDIVGSLNGDTPYIDLTGHLQVPLDGIVHVI